MSGSSRTTVDKDNPYVAPEAQLKAPPAPSRAGGWRNWLLILPVAAVAALPSYIIVALYVSAIRTATFLGHKSPPRPNDLPDFHPQTQFLELLIPSVAYCGVTWLISVLLKKISRDSVRLVSLIAIVPGFWMLCHVLLKLDPFGALYWATD